MQYKSEVYISNVTNLSDARYASGMLVDLIGFPLDEQMERHIDLNTFGAITGWLEGANIVVEVASEPIDSINRIIASYQPQFVSIPFERANEVLDMDCPVIVRLELTALNQITSLNPNILDSVSYFHILGEGDISVVREFAGKVPVLLGTGIDKDDLDKIIDLKIQGIVLSGSEEERPGYKDYDEIADILELWEA